ncbi:nuclear transport factor 2 family protein [Fulvivirga ulvae]|uniref:nuclear transport factor 2 family protein n=1 Tax=Fulvivirga ulvae TaxID=2904245 RepID=UPI001F2DFE64|nr:nuclear transport factor 2 family protein [Fulvivirga ulvae]UII32004.1 nuclear transport factor 2 family protein [Fulvivirga ulvae]
MKKIIIIILLGFSLTVQAQEKEPVNNFLDHWHKAAAEANADIFFGSIAEDGIYIGTDATERWDKESFWAFSKPYFERGKAWDFKPYDRQLHFSKDGKIAWFSELLETWMGVCRGSGVLRKSKDGWKIMQYHLSVTVPNEDIQDFIQLINQEK